MKNRLSDLTQVVVVSFNPDIKLLKKNLVALASQFTNILVVNNESGNVEYIKKLIASMHKKVELKCLAKNMGVAFAQNTGFDEARRKKLKWLLVMDQDSVIPSNLSKEYSQLLNQYHNIGILGWAYIPLKHNKELEENIIIISSGSLLNTQALARAGGFDNSLFIDHVDSDIQLKIKYLGFTTLATSKVKLYHRIGFKTGQRTITGKYYNGHSSIRMYYITRNGIVLCKRYLLKYPKWSLIFLRGTILELLYSFLNSDRKLANLKIASRAIVDGTRGKLGKYA